MKHTRVLIYLSLSLSTYLSFDSTGWKRVYDLRPNHQMDESPTTTSRPSAVTSSAISNDSGTTKKHGITTRGRSKLPQRGGGGVVIMVSPTSREEGDGEDSTEKKKKKKGEEEAAEKTREPLERPPEGIVSMV